MRAWCFKFKVQSFRGLPTQLVRIPVKLLKNILCTHDLAALSVMTGTDDPIRVKAYADVQWLESCIHADVSTEKVWLDSGLSPFEESHQPNLRHPLSYLTHPCAKPVTRLPVAVSSMRAMATARFQGWSVLHRRR